MATSFAVLCVFSLVKPALAWIARRPPAPGGVYACPSWLPLPGFALSVGLPGAQAAQLFG